MARAAATRKPRLSEREFQSQVTDLASALGWKWHHETYSLGTKPGWPDLALFHPVHGALFLELKVGKNEPSEEQVAWLSWLQHCQQKAYLCYPDDLGIIQALLQGEDIFEEGSET